MKYKKGHSDKTVTDHITRLMQEGKTPAQAIDIAAKEAGVNKNIHAPINIAVPSSKFNITDKK